MCVQYPNNFNYQWLIKLNLYIIWTCFISPHLIINLQTAEEKRTTVESITDEVKEMLEEMGHNFNLSSIRVMALMLRKILCTLFRKVLINREGLERVSIRELKKTTAITATLLNKRFDEQNNGCARAF